MSGTTERYRYRINGVLNTGDSVLANMEKLANSCASWISYDMFTGKWDVVINKDETVQKAFDDSNIIGGITLNGSSLRETYNSVEVRFPHSDLNNQMDYIKIEIPSGDRLPNEPDNTLNITYDLLNDPVQAQLLGLIELKQARLDKIITFKSDYSMVNLPAGAVISVTNDLYGWTEKLFRIVTIKEITEDGNLQSEITALEYDPSVYDTSDLYRYLRTNASGIVSIGSIGIPNAPQVTKFETDARPRVLIEADVTGGLVNAMEFWLTEDIPPGVGSDENRTYRLIGTKAADNGQNLTQGDTIEIEVDNISNINFLVKVRGVNGDVKGPFSTPSGSIFFAPTQVTDAIGSGTSTLDDSGNQINGLLAANALMYLLGQLFNGSTATGNAGVNSGSLWNTFWELFGDETGTPGNVQVITQGIGNAAKAGAKLQVGATAGKVTRGGLGVATTPANMYNFTFTPDISAQYKADCIIDQNFSGANGNINDIIIVYFYILQGSTIIMNSASGGGGAYSWTDFVLTDTANLTAGVTYTMAFDYVNSTVAGGNAEFDISWNVYTLAIS